MVRDKGDRIREEETRKRRSYRRRELRRRRLQVGFMKSGLALASLLCLFFLLKFFSSDREKAPAREISDRQTSQLKGGQDEPTFEEDTILIRAVGDNIPHESIWRAGVGKDGKWNYDFLYEGVKKDIQEADIAAVNQETIFVGDHKQVSAYPSFGSPKEVGDSLAKAGFDIVEHASNHTLDKGEEAVYDTLDFWEKEHPEVHVLGIHRAPDRNKPFTLLECKGVKLAFLNYTYHMNGYDHMVEEEEFPDYLVEPARRSRMKHDIELARRAADFVTVFLHIGTEYASQPDGDELDYLEFLLREGVDMTICSHSHTLQGFETLKDDQGHEMVTYYSLGNFMASQKNVKCLLGGMAEIKLRRGEDGSVEVANTKLKPLVIHYDHNKGAYGVYKLEDYTPELAADHSIHQVSRQPFTVELLKKMAARILDEEKLPSKQGRIAASGGD